MCDLHPLNYLSANRATVSDADAQGRDFERATGWRYTNVVIRRTEAVLTEYWLGTTTKDNLRGYITFDANDRVNHTFATYPVMIVPCGDAANSREQTLPSNR